MAPTTPIQPGQRRAGLGACPLGSRFSELLGQVEAELAGRARTPLDALAAFAEAELGLGVEDLLGAWARPALDELADHREALDAAEPDAEALELLGDVLRLAWRRHGLNDPSAEADEELSARIEGAERQQHQASARHDTTRSEVE